MSRKRLYMAYGSNLNLPQMAMRCPSAKPVGTAVLKDYELLFRGGRHGGVATVEPRGGAAVPILVWAIKPCDEEALDRYEGYPRLYSKRMMETEMDGIAISAMAYVLTPGHDAGFPSRHYLSIIAEGYKSTGFDLHVLETALDRTEQIMAEEIKLYEAERDRLEAELKQGPGYCQGSLFDMHWR